MNAKSKTCNWCEFPADIKTDRLALLGRRGTGKSTAVKKAIADRGLTVIWIARTKELAAGMADRFVPPAVADVLPKVEDYTPDVFPEWRLGDGWVRVVPIRSAAALRDTGIDVHGRQADLIVNDEAIRPDGLYARREPELLDDLAGTIGRSGKLPKIVIIGNPTTNACPYAYAWRVNLLVEGVYEHKGMSTEVIGTAGCKDCFGRKIGRDPEPVEYAAHLSDGGDVIVVNGCGLRVRWVNEWLYAGLADADGPVMMTEGRMSALSYRPAAIKLLLKLRASVDAGQVVYDSFEAQMRLYELLRLK